MKLRRWTIEKIKITIEGPPKTGCSTLAVKVARLIRGHNPGMPLSVIDPDATQEEVMDEVVSGDPHRPLFVDGADVSIVVRRTPSDDQLITLVDHGRYRSVMFGRKCVGTAYRLEDGCYYYEQSADGVMAAWSMRAIADKLDELNREWEGLIAKMAKEGK